MCVNNLSKVALDSAAAGIEPMTSSRKSNALSTAPPSHTKRYFDLLFKNCSCHSSISDYSRCGSHLWTGCLVWRSQQRILLGTECIWESNFKAINSVIRKSIKFFSFSSLKDLFGWQNSQTVSYFIKANRLHHQLHTLHFYWFWFSLCANIIHIFILYTLDSVFLFFKWH